MTAEIKRIAEKLIKKRRLSLEEYENLIANRDTELFELFKAEALKLRHEIYGNKIFIRGLIEISNYCKNDCLYCGIRRSSISCERYRLSAQEILSACDSGYRLGFRTFVLQGGEDAFFSDKLLCDLIKTIKEKYPDCAVTLSLGERSRESYQRLFDAGADRYLLRHETADVEHYGLLHPSDMTLTNRIECLKELKEIGYQVGCGMMVGSPFQTAKHLAGDLKFIEEFQPDMCGIGPFIPHKDTPFKNEKNGGVELTCFLLAVIRIIKPDVLLPATTALATLAKNGREMGVEASANVVMPNLSPVAVRDKYTLYDNKLHSGTESAEKLQELKNTMKAIGYEIVCDRGDIIKQKGDIKNGYI